MESEIVSSVAAGLAEARSGCVNYIRVGRIVADLNDEWNPRPVVRESPVGECAPAVEDGVVLRNIRTASRAAFMPSTEKRPPPWFVGMSSEFSRDIVKIDRKLQGRILEALVEIAKNPIELRGDTVKPLAGDLKGCWRYRIAGHRIIYSPDKNTGDITLLAFASRSSAYAE